MQNLLVRISADRGFYGFIVAYAAVALLCALYLADLKWFNAFIYFGRWLGFASMMFLAYIAVMLAQSRFAKGEEQLSIMQVLTDGKSGFVLFLYLSIFQGVFTSMKMMMPEVTPFQFDAILADIDEFIHFGAPWEYLRFLDPYTVIVRLFYTPFWVTLIMAAVFLACLAPPGPLRSQFLWTYMLCWTVLGNVVAMAFMSAGPIYYENLLGDPRFAGLTSHLQTVTYPDDPLSQIPNMLWASYLAKTAGIGTGISAFPSLHLSITTLFVLASFRLRRWLGWVMTGYLLLIMAGSVHLGWHYAIDGYFSILATISLWAMVGAALRRKAGNAATVPAFVGERQPAGIQLATAGPISET